MILFVYCPDTKLTLKEYKRIARFNKGCNEQIKKKLLNIKIGYFVQRTAPFQFDKSKVYSFKNKFCNPCFIK